MARITKYLGVKLFFIYCYFVYLRLNKERKFNFGQLPEQHNIINKFSPNNILKYYKYLDNNKNIRIYNFINIKNISYFIEILIFLILVTNKD